MYFMTQKNVLSSHIDDHRQNKLIFVLMFKIKKVLLNKLIKIYIFV